MDVRENACRCMLKKGEGEGAEEVKIFIASFLVFCFVSCLGYSMRFKYVVALRLCARLVCVCVCVCVCI